MSEHRQATGPGCGGCWSTPAGATRRQVLSGTGVVAAGAAAAGLLSACGGGGKASPATTAADGSVTVPAADTSVGGSTFYADAEVIVTQPAAGDYRAFDATCPHQGCATSDSEDGVLVCPCHGSQFDKATGDVVQGPATTGLTPLEVSVDGEDLVIRG